MISIFTLKQMFLPSFLFSDTQPVSFVRNYLHGQALQFLKNANHIM